MARWLLYAAAVGSSLVAGVLLVTIGAEEGSMGLIAASVPWFGAALLFAVKGYP